MYVVEMKSHRGLDVFAAQGPAKNGSPRVSQSCSVWIELRRAEVTRRVTFEVAVFSAGGTAWDSLGPQSQVQTNDHVSRGATACGVGCAHSHMSSLRD